MDLVRTDSTLHLAIGLVDGLDNPSGIAYAASTDDGPWTVDAVDTGDDVTRESPWTPTGMRT